MTKNIRVSVRISHRLDEKLEKLATLSGRSKSWLINDALGEYAKFQIKFVKAVRLGMRERREGKWIAHEDVIAEFERRKKRRTQVANTA